MPIYDMPGCLDSPDRVIYTPIKIAIVDNCERVLFQESVTVKAGEKLSVIIDKETMTAKLTISKI